MGRKKRTKAAQNSSKEHIHEKGSIKKKWKNRLPIALIFPNKYSLGMSNLGFQLVYDLLNQNDSIVAERFFSPETGNKPLSIESGRPLADFPLIFFSVSFEQDYLNLIMLLQYSGISALASERSKKSQGIKALSAGGQPLIVAGGVATFMNPEPLAPFIDLFIIGEAEPLLNKVVTFLLKGIKKDSKEKLLATICSKLPGCYGPEMYQVNYDNSGNLESMHPKAEYPLLPKRIKKVALDTVPDQAAHSKILTPDAEFSNLFMVELGRGCSRGCRFCAAGFIYRPPRLWNAQSIIAAIDSRPSDCSRIGLLGMEMARPEDIAEIANYLAKKDCSLSFSSLRADIFNPSLTDLLAGSNLKSAAIAPDGASERLRRVINKGITETDVLSAAEILAKKDIKNLKLYFMIGLPTELDSDLEEMVELIMKVKEIILAIGRAKGRLGTITLSINCFIPKPWTPFQFHPMEKVAVLKQKLKFLRKELGSQPNIRIKAESPDKALFQSILSRGDRRLGMALLKMVEKKYTWRQAFKELHLNPEEYSLRLRSEKELFSWEIIDHSIDKKYLWADYQKGLQAQKTVPCDTSRCKRCGVC